MPSGSFAGASEDRSSDEGDLAPLVRETLERLVTPAAAEAVIELALLRSGELALPETARELAAFIRGALFSATACELGRDVAEVVVEDLAPILKRARRSDPAPERPSSGVRPKDPQRRSRQAAAMVLVATEDRSRARAWREALTPEHVVVWVGDAFDLVARLEGLVAAELTVVVDCRMPSARPACMDSLRDRLPPRTRVLLSDCARRLKRQLAALRLPATWMLAPPDEPLEALVALLRPPPG